MMDGMFDPRNKLNTRRDLVWKDFHFLPKSKSVHCSQRLVVSHPSEECDGCKSEFPVDWVSLNSHNKRTMYDRLNTEREGLNLMVSVKVPKGLKSVHTRGPKILQEGGKVSKKKRKKTYKHNGTN